MDDDTGLLFDLPSVGRKKVSAAFDVQIYWPAIGEMSDVCAASAFLSVIKLAIVSENVAISVSLLR